MINGFYFVNGKCLSIGIVCKQILWPGQAKRKPHDRGLNEGRKVLLIVIKRQHDL
tara:strand:- start:934 stop:1098 length:165 start_codon:yes stop_codon:yes gene_type:complete